MQDGNKAHPMALYTWTTDNTCVQAVQIRIMLMIIGVNLAPRAAEDHSNDRYDIDMDLVLTCSAVTLPTANAQVTQSY